MNRSRFNDGSAHPPALRVQHALWPLLELPSNCKADGPPAWTLDEELARVRQPAFAGVRCLARWLVR